MIYNIVSFLLSNNYVMSKLSNPNTSDTTNTPKHWWKSKVKNAALITAVAATLFSGSGCRKAPDRSANSARNAIEQSDATTVKKVDNVKYFLSWGEDNQKATLICNWKVIENVNANSVNTVILYEKDEWSYYILTKGGEELEVEIDEL